MSAEQNSASQYFPPEHKVRSGITHGGIGTGGIELGKDGVFRQWHICNNAPFGGGPVLGGPEWRDNGLLFLRYVTRCRAKSRA